MSGVPRPAFIRPLAKPAPLSRVTTFTCGSCVQWWMTSRELLDHVLEHRAACDGDCEAAS